MSERHFYGQDAIALLELDPNERFVPIAALAEIYGLDRASEELRVQQHTVLAAGALLFEVERDDGTSEDALCLRVDLVPLWVIGIAASTVADDDARARLLLLQREAASVLWHAFRPQGFGPEDTLLPERGQQNPAEQAYATALGMAALSRQQLMIERQLDAAEIRADATDPYAASGAIDDPQAELLARAVRRVALAAQERTLRNEYNGITSGLYRQYGITSYRKMPRGRLIEALEWLDRWRGDLMDEPEPPPVI